MSKSSYPVLVLFVLILVPQSWSISNAVVGTCRNGTHYTTVQAAIESVAAGGTVEVCPGTYPEVLTITKDLTLRGISFDNSDGVIITVPSTGVPMNGTNAIWGSLAPQVLVQNATANLSNLTIDGGGGTSCASGANTSVGVLFQQAGGSMTNSTLQNPASCINTVSVLLDHTTNLNFSNNYLWTCVLICVEIDYATATTVKGNNISSLSGALTDFGTLAGIEIQYLGGPATISANDIGGGVRYGVFVQSSPSVTITDNNVMADLQFGAGIYLVGATQATVEGNRLMAPYGVWVQDNGTAGGNTVMTNTLIGGSCGLKLTATNQGDTTKPNTYYDESQTVCTN